MPMELYSSEAFVRDLVNAISRAEGRPLNIGGNRHSGIDRAYAFQLIAQARKAIEGNAGPEGNAPATKQPVSRSAEIQKLMKKLDEQESAEREKPARAAKPRSRRKAVAAPA